MTADEVLEAFENETLSPGHFRHENHIHLAWVYFQRWPLLEVLPRYRDALRGFAERVGASGLYHETITWSFLFLIHDRIEREGARGTWEEFRARNEDLVTEGKNLLLRYYQPETLDSDLARRTFVFPDRAGPEALAVS